MKNKENGILCWKKCFNKSGNLLEQIWFQFGKIPTSSILKSSPMTTGDKIGLTITIISFAIILFPLASSDSDPYQMKWLLEDTRETFMVIGDYIIPQADDDKVDEKRYKIIAHLKLSFDKSQGDVTEKLFLGKLKTRTS